MIAVAGVSGHTGRAAANALLDQGAAVRVIVRDEKKGAEWKARGADVAVASLNDPAGLTRALTGARAAYLLIPPAYTAPDLLATQTVTREAIVRAIADSGVGHVVFLSSIGAQHASGTGPVKTLHEAEQALRTLRRPVTLLRAPYFMENWAAVLPVVISQGMLPSFLPLDKAIETAATADIGEHAASVLSASAPSAARVVEFAGPRPYSPREVAGELSRAIGRPVTPVQAPLDQVVPTFTSGGIAEGAARLLQEMYAAIAADVLVFEKSAPDARGKRTPADALAPLLVRS